MHFSKNIECGIVFSKLLHQINNPHLIHDNDDKQILNNVQKSFIRWLQNGGQSKFTSVNTNLQSSGVNIPTNNNIMNDVSTHEVRIQMLTKMTLWMLKWMMIYFV